MPSVQVGVRIPHHLHQKLEAHATVTESFKSEVIISALAHYLDCTEDIPLTQRVTDVEQKLAALETEVRAMKQYNNLNNAKGR